MAWAGYQNYKYYICFHKCPKYTFQHKTFLQWITPTKIDSRITLLIFEILCLQGHIITFINIILLLQSQFYTLNFYFFSVLECNIYVLVYKISSFYSNKMANQLTLNSMVNKMRRYRIAGI